MTVGTVSAYVVSGTGSQKQIARGLKQSPRLLVRVRMPVGGRASQGEGVCEAGLPAGRAGVAVGGSGGGVVRGGFARRVRRGAGGLRGRCLGGSWRYVRVSARGGKWRRRDWVRRAAALGGAGASGGVGNRARPLALLRRKLFGGGGGGFAFGFRFSFSFRQFEVQLDGGDSFGAFAGGIEGDLFADQAALQVGHGFPRKRARRGGWLRRVGMIDTRRGRRARGDAIARSGIRTGVAIGNGMGGHWEGGVIKSANVKGKDSGNRRMAHSVNSADGGESPGCDNLVTDMADTMKAPEIIWQGMAVRSARCRLTTLSDQSDPAQRVPTRPSVVIG